MPLNFFSAIAAKIFGDSASAGSTVEPELVELAVEAVIDTVDPRLRAVADYRKKLAGGAAATILHLRQLARLLPAPMELTRALWRTDPHLNAMFATADHVPAALGGSPELRNWFEANPAANEAYALLGMLMTERTVFAPALVDGQLRHDVRQTTVSFSKHKLLAPAADAATCRREVGTLIFKRLAAIALERITQLGERATALEQRKAMLSSRLRLLQLKRDGIEQLAGAGAGAETAEIERIEAELGKTAEETMATKAQLATFAARLEQVNAVLQAPADNVNAVQVVMRVNRMGYKIEAGSSEPGAELRLTELTLGDGLKIIIAFVRCLRADLPPKESLIAKAAREML